MIDLHPAQGPRLALQLSAHEDGMIVRAVESLVGGGAAAIVLPPLQDVLGRISQPTFHEDVGRGLFRALLPGALGDLVRTALAQATEAGDRLTLDLRFDRELVGVARYPWELLHDGKRFLLQSDALNLVRSFDFAEPVGPVLSHGPLEILAVAARPHDQPPLASEFEMLYRTFQKEIAGDLLDLAYLLPPTWAALMDWALAGAPGVLHFEGHGALSETGRLVFEDGGGQSDPVDATVFGHAFSSTNLRLAVLSACHSARSAGESLLSRAAPALILAGIPAVVAMQQSLPDEVAARFSRGFYHALLAGQDIESALAASRRPLARSTFWYIPSLYVRASQPRRTPSVELERRFDTAGPRTAPVNRPLRVGLWAGRTDMPLPDREELRRLIGAEPAASGRNTPVYQVSPAAVGPIRSGTLEVRLRAPGCDLHAAPDRSITVLADFDTPPLWFPMTPRQVGPQDITIELAQGGTVVATLLHTLQVTDGAVGEPVIALVSHGAVPPAPVSVYVPDSESREPVRDHPPHREGEEDQTHGDTPVPRAPTDTSELEALDGVKDWLQSGEPPETEDEPIESRPPGTEIAEKQLDDKLLFDLSDRDVRPLVKRSRPLEDHARPLTMKTEPGIITSHVGGWRSPRGIWIAVAAVLLVVLLVLVVLVWQGAV